MRFILLVVFALATWGGVADAQGLNAACTNLGDPCFSSISFGIEQTCDTFQSPSGCRSVPDSYCGVVPGQPAILCFTGLTCISDACTATATQGISCYAGDDGCAGALKCTEPLGTAGICYSEGAQGETCSTTPGDGLYCGAGLYCSSADGDTCQPLKAAGETCTGQFMCDTNLTCANGYCQGPVGTTCATSFACLDSGSPNFATACDPAVQRCALLFNKETCTGDADCFTGLECAEGTCLRAVGETCATNADCASDICQGATCRNGFEGPCAQQADCASSFTCAEGSCLKNPGASCFAGSECSTGSCLSNKCAQIQTSAGESCAQTFEVCDATESALFCNSNLPSPVCEPRRDAGSQCAELPDECANGYACDAGYCRGTYDTPCANNTFCVTGTSLCVDGVCRKVPGEACTIDAECVEGVCKDGSVCGEILSDVDAPCDTFGVCNATAPTSLYCAAGEPDSCQARGAQGAACTNDPGACLGDLPCVDGTCRGPPGSACEADAACEAPSTCVGGTCLLPDGEACTEGGECAAGACPYGSCRPVLTEVGAPCVGNSAPPTPAGTENAAALCDSGAGANLFCATATPNELGNATCQPRAPNGGACKPEELQGCLALEGELCLPESEAEGAATRCTIPFGEPCTPGTAAGDASCETGVCHGEFAVCAVAVDEGAACGEQTQQCTPFDTLYCNATSFCAPRLAPGAQCDPELPGQCLTACVHVADEELHYICAPYPVAPTTAPTPIPAPAHEGAAGLFIAIGLLMGFILGTTAYLFIFSMWA